MVIGGDLGSANTKCVNIRVLKIGIKLNLATTVHRERGMGGWGIQQSCSLGNGDPKQLRSPT